MELLKIDGHPCQFEALSRREQASVPLIRYRLTSPGEDSLDLALHETTRLLGHPARVHASSVKEGIHLAGDRRRQFRFQEITAFWAFSWLIPVFVTIRLITCSFMVNSRPAHDELRAGCC